MVDLDRVINGLARSGLASGLAGGLAGGALTGALTSKRGRKAAGTLLKVGGLAAVGGLAWKAYRGYQQSQSGQRFAADNAPTHTAAADGSAAYEFDDANRWLQMRQQDFDAVVSDRRSLHGGARLLIRAMIAAAMADGHLDREEHLRIFTEIERMDLTAEEKATIVDELRRPLTLEQVIVRAGDPQTATEVYAASLMAIDESLPAGRRYLERLAEGLDLPAALVESLHERVRRERLASAA